MRQLSLTNMAEVQMVIVTAKGKQKPVYLIYYNQNINGIERQVRYWRCN